MKTKKTKSTLDKMTPEERALHEKKKAEFAACKTMKQLDKAMHKYRSDDMLTVQDLIDYLKTQNPRACVVGFEQNSNAYIEYPKELPNMYVCTVKEDKKRARKHIKAWYRHDSPDEIKKKVKEEMKEMYRYTEDDDVIFAIGN